MHQQTSNCFEVTKTFNINEPTAVEVIGNGSVNQTYKILSPDKAFILQAISPIVTNEVVEDGAVIMLHMAREGWPTPLPQTTSVGSYVHVDSDGNRWRAMSYVPSENTAPSVLPRSSLRSIGSLVANWHSSLAKLAYHPTGSITHFHDTPYYFERLFEVLPDIPSVRAKTIGKKILQKSKLEDNMPQFASQLIHGDPKLANILFRDGEPLVLIDYDTLMSGSVWYDIGDLLRSVSAHYVQARKPVPPRAIREVLDGYTGVTRLYKDWSKTKLAAYEATRVVSLELAARYLIDIVEATYFDWDSVRFASRSANHTYRAGIQLKIIEQLTV